MEKAKAKQRVASTAKRKKAFAKTLQGGTSADYMNYLQRETNENRIIERNL